MLISTWLFFPSIIEKGIRLYSFFFETNMDLVNFHLLKQLVLITNHKWLVTNYCHPAIDCFLFFLLIQLSIVQNLHIIAFSSLLTNSCPNYCYCPAACLSRSNPWVPCCEPGFVQLHNSTPNGYGPQDRLQLHGGAGTSSQASKADQCWGAFKNPSLQVQAYALWLWSASCDCAHSQGG